MYQRNNPVIYASQTQNVFSVDLPTPQTNSVWPFPVNVIPRVNTSRHGGSPAAGRNYQTRHRNQMQNPLLGPPHSPRAGPDGGHSRAATILGNAGSGWYDHPGHVSASSSAVAKTSGDYHKTLQSSRAEPLPRLHKTCTSTLHGCQADRKCRRLLDEVLAACHEDACDHELCKKNLQKFYRNADVKWAMDVAFCLCKKTPLTPLPDGAGAAPPRLRAAAASVRAAALPRHRHHVQGGQRLQAPTGVLRAGVCGGRGHQSLRGFQRRVPLSRHGDTRHRAACHVHLRGPVHPGGLSLRGLAENPLV